jgi:CRP-like cAMP-binding protein
MPRKLVWRLKESTRHLWRQQQNFDPSAHLRDLGDHLQADVLSELRHSASIATSPLFGAAPPAFVRALVQRLRVQAFLPGEVIANVGEPSTEMFCVHEGVVRVSEPANDGDGEEEPSQAREMDVFDELKAGDVFGESDTLLCEPRSLRYTAGSYVTLYSLSRDDVDRVLADYPQLVSSLTAQCLARSGWIAPEAAGPRRRSSASGPSGAAPPFAAKRRSSAMAMLDSRAWRTTFSCASRTTQWLRSSDFLKSLAMSPIFCPSISALFFAERTRITTR